MECLKDEMKNHSDIYLYGAVLLTTSFLLRDAYPGPDSYAEYTRKVTTCGGETGTCALVLASLRVSVKIDGNFLGHQTYEPIKSCFSNLPIDYSAMTYDAAFDGLEDFVITSKDNRTSLGRFIDFFDAKNKRRWNNPSREDVKNAKVVGLDPFFFEQSQEVMSYCVEYQKPYVTIDCEFDSEIHKNAAVTIVSHEFLKQHYQEVSIETLMKKFRKANNGLTIFTFGSSSILYSRDGINIKSIEPFKTNVVSTLGAGDCFKAGIIYGVLNQMSDEAMIKFASATAALALTHYPILEKPPKLDEIYKMMKEGIK